jgi:hypothetical protein
MAQRNIVPHAPRSQNTSRESRRFRRIRCSEETHFVTRQRLHEGVIKNFSRGGTYIEVEGSFFAGQEITVAGPFNAGWRECKQKGAIVRCDGRGIGVKFSAPAAA